ncbi:MAG TPA: hypothetical protein VHB74_00775, partial [Devosia sp.]|nr:hypothetical protein [Devosia sp.]
MQFLTSLVGGSGSLYLNAALALAIVLVLIFLGLWALKLLFRASSTAVRGRNKRLAIVDTLAIDAKRQLLIVRRDNVEHLIMTGGPQDVLIESGIAAASAVPATVRTLPPPRGPAQTPVQTAAAAQRLQAARTRRAPAAIEAAPAASNDQTPPAAGRPAPRRGGSLRYTGLMRPVRMEPVMTPPANTDNSAPGSSDSATRAGVTPFDLSQDGNGQAFERS